MLVLDKKGDFYIMDRNATKKKHFHLSVCFTMLIEGNIGLSTTSLIFPSIPKSEYTVFLYKNLFKRTFSLKFAKDVGSEKNNLFVTAFTFLNPESLNYIILYMESECT